MRRSSLSLIVCLLAAGCGGEYEDPGAASTSGGSTSGGSTGGGSTGGGSTTLPPVPNQQLVAIETVDVGDDSPRGAAQGAHELHVATDSDWAFVWTTHSQAALPQVDFTQESVVGTFMGPMNPGAQFTRVINVSRNVNSDDLHAVVREFRPGAWWSPPLVPVGESPFHLVRCATAVSGQGALTVSRQTLLDFTPLRAGSDSALGAGDPTYAGGVHVARDDAALSALFAQVLPGVRPPGIDFRTDMVVAVLGPYLRSYGNSVQTLRLVHDATSDQIRVISRINPYRGGAAPPPATETPYQFLLVSRARGTIRPEQTSPVTHTPLAEGTTQLYRGPAETLVVRDAATFGTLWASRIGTAVPRIDFAVDQVLVAFEQAGNRKILRGAESVLLEDDELSVTVKTLTTFGVPNTGAPYLMVTTPRNFGPVGFETIDVTPTP